MKLPYNDFIGAPISIGVRDASDGQPSFCDVGMATRWIGWPSTWLPESNEAPSGAFAMRVPNDGDSIAHAPHSKTSAG